MNLQPSRLTIDTDEEGRLVLSGVVDAHTAPVVDEQAAEIGAGADVHLDLAAVNFVDSSGLRALVTWHEDLANAGHQLVMHSPAASVLRLLEITGLRELLHVR